MAVKSRIDAWTLLRVLVVPCLFLCAIFKRPIFQWIACAALFVWVCFVFSKLFRSHRKHCKKMPAEQKAFPAKQETKPLTDATAMSALAACKEKYNGVARKGVEAIEMKLKGYEATEIAKHYDTSVNNVNAWISRARSKLRNEPALLEILY